MLARPFTIAVASGKGGTGKTLIATNLAVAAAGDDVDCVLADCDVEAPNDHLFIATAEDRVDEVEAIVARVQEEYCTGCGKAKDSCNFGALRLMGNKAMIFEELCHGCGKCGWICPVGAIREETVRGGETVTGRSAGHDGLTLVTGRLDVGGVKSPTVIRAARARAQRLDPNLLVLDAPPGVACSAVAATRGADAILLVTEPTPFGIHDLELSLELARELGIPAAILVNRVGTGDADVESVAAAWDAPVIAGIPFDRRVAEAYAGGKLLLEESETVAEAVRSVLDWVRKLAADGSTASAGVEVAS